MRDSQDSDRSVASLTQAGQDDAFEPNGHHPGAPPSLDEDDIEKAYSMAIERLRMLASGVNGQNAMPLQLEGGAFTPRHRAPAGGAPESQSGAPPRRASEDANKPRIPETRQQLAVLRAVANTAAVKSLNAYVRKRQRPAKAVLLMALALLVALAALMPRVISSAPYGVYFAGAALLLNALLITGSLLVVRRLERMRVLERDASREREDASRERESE